MLAGVVAASYYTDPPRSLSVWRRRGAALSSVPLPNDVRVGRESCIAVSPAIHRLFTSHLLIILNVRTSVCRRRNGDVPD